MKSILKNITRAQTALRLVSNTHIVKRVYLSAANFETFTNEASELIDYAEMNVGKAFMFGVEIYKDQIPDCKMDIVTSSGESFTWNLEEVQ